MWGTPIDPRIAGVSGDGVPAQPAQKSAAAASRRTKNRHCMTAAYYPIAKDARSAARRDPVIHFTRYLSGSGRFFGRLRQGR
ncbi:Hypothetical protein A7982_10265 [Minicystis rosea]|nr:Hypothetical protein A7982_10265 [Minicystis rosea]